MDDPATAFGLGGKPFWFVLLALWVIVLVRSHSTYWIARAVAHGLQLGTDRQIGPRWWLSFLARVDTWSHTPKAQRGLARVHQYGPYAVAPAYLTMGLQTVTVFSAGLVQMPYRRFTAASLVGGAGWAVIWSTVGLAALWATAALVARSGWGVAVAVILAGILTTIWWHRRHRTKQPIACTESVADPQTVSTEPSAT